MILENGQLTTVFYEFANLQRLIQMAQSMMVNGIPTGRKTVEVASELSSISMKDTGKKARKTVEVVSSLKMESI